MTFQPKYKKLLENDKVRRWHENMRARSTLSADVWLRNLGLYCKINSTSPDKILEQATKGTLKDNFQDFVREMESLGKRGTYISKFKFTLRSWLSYNDTDYKLNVNIKNGSL